MKRGEIVLFVSSKLSQTEKKQLPKLVELLDGRMADTFSGSGSVCVGLHRPPPGGLIFLNVPEQTPLKPNHK